MKEMNVLPKYAVVLKTHFWDEFCTRQLERLLSVAGTADVYILVDETKQRVTGIPHTKIVRMTEADSISQGFFAHPAGNLFWYNTDYQLYYFVEKFPQFEYIVTCEYDCIVNFDIAKLVHCMVGLRLDFAGESIRTPPAEWRWAELARPYYNSSVEMSGRLLCFAAFSREFALALRDARLDHSNRLKAGEIEGANLDIQKWPNNEAFVGAEISRLRIRETDLSRFGSLKNYDWAPPYFEPQLASINQAALIHPVLYGPRYVRSIAKFGWNLQDLFSSGSFLHYVMQQSPLEDVLHAFFPVFFEKGDFESIERLRNYAISRGSTDRLFNIAPGKPATQSSTCEWSFLANPADDAALAITGTINGKYFHTGADESPWWCLDLLKAVPVREIYIHNRPSHAYRARDLQVQCSFDLETWETVFEADAHSGFADPEDARLSIVFDPPCDTRFIRLRLPRKDVLHLEQVEVLV